MISNNFMVTGQLMPAKMNDYMLSILPYNSLFKSKGAKCTTIIVCFRFCETWGESINISWFPWSFFIRFSGIKSQYFAGYYSARICLIKAKEIEEKWRGKWRWRRRKWFGMLIWYRFESLQSNLQSCKVSKENTQ